MQTISIPAGSTSVSVFVNVIDLATGLDVLGLDATALPKLVYSRMGAASANVNTSDLATEATAWTSGGILYVAGVGYRVDLPNAAIASGVGRVLISLVDSVASPAAAGTVNIELKNVTTDFSGSAVRRVAAR